ncbi:histidine phosphatase family protein [Oceanobacillus sp. CFH 90083]|uniref:histidine phosphatase family protein n=1 Tax=Oceanobacillus sp. CFH 90083 TaxID=2592336 RepID=UPI00128E8667|nr:histidine phosphatase family protein [Oceanobacillus sp. CFH 90083]
MSTWIYMVRHAESPFKFGEERTRRLSAEGEIDAQKVCNVLLDKQVDSIVSSPYTRAVQTVQVLAEQKGLAITEYEALKERAIKGLNYKLSEQELLKAVKKSFEDKNYCLSGGESTFQAQNRSIPIIKRLLEDYAGKHIVIGTHGNIMTIIMNYFDDAYGYDFWKSTSKPDIYRLEFEGEHLKAVERLWRS